MNELLEEEGIIIEEMIYEINGVQVMLDSDIAKLYQVETKRVNEAVKIILINFQKDLVLELQKMNIIL
ncbi:MAG: ORF6N domain-containing protein [Firmicutes bacterium]|nr:ORF6N domain-containing protein [Bacillota bacterium]